MIDDRDVDQQLVRLLGATAALYLPLTRNGHTVGVITVYDKQGGDPRFSDADMRLAHAFADRVTTVLHIAAQAADTLGKNRSRPEAPSEVSGSIAPAATASGSRAAVSATDP